LPLCIATNLSLDVTLRVDTVEKGKNEPIKIFTSTPVETGFS
jgi:hypothetical protein